MFNPCGRKGSNQWSSLCLIITQRQVWLQTTKNYYYNKNMAKSYNVKHNDCNSISHLCFYLYDCHGKWTNILEMGILCGGTLLIIFWSVSHNWAWLIYQFAIYYRLILSLYRYISIGIWVFQHAPILKLFSWDGKSAWSSNLKWWNYVVCPAEGCLLSNN